MDTEMTSLVESPLKVAVSFQAVLEVSSAMPAVLQIEAAGGTHKDCDEDGYGLHARLFEIPAVTLARRQRVIGAKFDLSPNMTSECYGDLFGNLCRRFLVPEGQIAIDYSALIEIDNGREPERKPYEQNGLELPPEVMPYLLPSRYCESDRMGDEAYSLFGDQTPGFERVSNIERWINEHFVYMYGVSDVSTSAINTMSQRSGVCRDFAHVGISLCRALNIPARYVSGYCPDLETPDLHAWFQAYLDGVWTNFDATATAPRKALVEVAVGRDAVDCAWCTFFGIGETKSMTVDATLVR